MFNFLRRLFTKYVHPVEKKIDRFFDKINSRTPHKKVEKQLLKFMQKDLIVLNLWLEKKFKGYSGLTKKRRASLYKNVKFMVQDFQEDVAKNIITPEKLHEQLLILDLDLNADEIQKLTYLMAIMHFLRPGHHYEYLESASFDKLLVDPENEIMMGDCNQIVTIYIYLYSLMYPVDDLELKLLPGHICLHFNGIDIEATTGSFHKYQTYDDIIPVTEIISTNLLDVHDYREERYKLSARTVLKSANLAFLLSSKRELVEKNLNIAYRNLGVAAANINDFKAAIYYLKEAGAKDLLKNIYHNAALYYSKKANFDKAHYYAEKTKIPKLMRTVTDRKAAYYYKKGDFTEAISLYESLENQQMLKACYQQEYNQLLQKVKNIKTLKEQKRNKQIYQKLLKLAKLADNQKAIDQLGKIIATIETIAR